MSLTGAASCAASVSALVRVSGNDADGQARGQAAFHTVLTHDGSVALSASGAVLHVNDDNNAVTLLAPAAPFAAFITQSSTEKASLQHVQAHAGALTVEVLLSGDVQTKRWRTASVLAMLDLSAAVPDLAQAVGLLAAHGAATDASTWVAALSISVPKEVATAIRAALAWRSAAGVTPGDALAACGAPFGCLAPAAFSGSVWSATVSQVLPWRSDARHAVTEWPRLPPAALLLDMQFMPGMEGAPMAVCSGGAEDSPPATCCAFLLCPLRPVRAATAVCIGVTTDTLVAALRASGLLPHGALDNMLLTRARLGASHPGIEAALRAVAMLSAAGAPSWGTCVCVAPQAGLFLTAAHVVHPGAPAASAGRAQPLRGTPWTTTIMSRAQDEHAGSNTTQHAAFPHLPNGAAASAHIRPWHSSARAVLSARTVWVSRGPLDVALVQIDGDGLETPRFTQLHPTRSPDTHLAPGARVLVAGHAHFGPASGHDSRVGGDSAWWPPPVVTAGCVSAHDTSAALLRVSAAVHAGASGGAVLCPSTGALLGLVTSNAALTQAGSAATSSGQPRSTSLPALNFSVAAPALEALCAACAAVPAGCTLRPGTSGQAGATAVAAACAALDSPDDRISHVWALRTDGGASTQQPLPAQLPGAGPKLTEFLRSRL